MTDALNPAAVKIDTLRSRYDNAGVDYTDAGLGVSISDYVAAGNTVDVFLVENGFRTFRDNGLPEDVEEYSVPRVLTFHRGKNGWMLSGSRLDFGPADSPDDSGIPADDLAIDGADFADE